MPATAIPTSPSELEELLNDKTRFAEVVKDKNGFQEFASAYFKAFNVTDPDFSKKVQEEASTQLLDFLRKHDAGTPKNVNLAPGGGLLNKIGDSEVAPGAKVDTLLDGKSHREFLRNIHHKATSAEAVKFQESLREIKDSFGSSIPSDGGFLIPETLRSNLLSIALESAVVRPRATVIPMDSLRVPFPTIDSTSNESSVFGGMVGYWTEEAGELAESSAKFSRVILEAKKLTGYSEVPNELFADSIISFTAFLNQHWPMAIAWFEDIAFLTGTGVGEPLGMLGANCAVGVTRNTASEVRIEDIAAMYTRMLPSSLNRAVWLCSPAVLQQLLLLTLRTSAGEPAGGPSLWLQGGFNAAGAPTMSILGRPLLVSEKVPNLGSEGDLSFVDFGYYLLGDRQSMQMDASPHFKFNTDQTAVRIIERVDGRPWLNNAITPANSGNTLSPVVKLSA